MKSVFKLRLEPKYTPKEITRVIYELARHTDATVHGEPGRPFVVLEPDCDGASAPQRVAGLASEYNDMISTILNTDSREQFEAGCGAIEDVAEATFGPPQFRVWMHDCVVDRIGSSTTEAHKLVVRGHVALLGNLETALELNHEAHGRWGGSLIYMVNGAMERLARRARWDSDCDR